MLSGGAKYAALNLRKTHVEERITLQNYSRSKWVLNFFLIFILHIASCFLFLHPAYISTFSIDM